MGKQFNDMRNDYADQLNIIENNFNTERQKILNRNKDEIQYLFEEQKKKEQSYQEQKEKKESENTLALEGLRTNDANDMVEQKIKLEKEMSVLQSCMEDMKAIYKLNEEKLTFNFQVLTDREKVDKSTQESLKKKERRLKITK